ncbi:hypothetical protein BJX68DRAFT_271567 [Aspergillus pseudodeflectus]|uniref:Galactosyl transferase GMA12/MNN10 family protein n=1 Tax=Aspergillus pseudodeflectus TaxID=176178 RepID=A0ABR4JKR3_9EURO
MNTYGHRGQRPKLKCVLHAVLFLIGVFWVFRLFHNYPLGAQQPQPKVGKVMSVYGNHSVYERTLATHEQHGRHWGYPLFVLKRPILDGYWNKLAILLSVMLQELAKPVDQRLEWLFWSDADTIVMNPNIPLEIFLPPPQLSHIHLLLTKDWNGLNNGVFPIRVHPWSVELLTAAISYPIVHPDIPLYWPDQSAMNKLFQENEYFARSVLYCPLRWFNAYMRSPDGETLNPDSPPQYQVHPGYLLVHFPGTPAEHLEQTLVPYLDIAEAHRAEWEVPLEETQYTREIEDFWKKQIPAVQEV